MRRLSIKKKYKQQYGNKIREKEEFLEPGKEDVVYVIMDPGDDGGDDVLVLGFMTAVPKGARILSGIFIMGSDEDHFRQYKPVKYWRYGSGPSSDKAQEIAKGLIGQDWTDEFQCFNLASAAVTKYTKGHYKPGSIKLTDFMNDSVAVPQRWMPKMVRREWLDGSIVADDIKSLQSEELNVFEKLTDKVPREWLTEGLPNPIPKEYLRSKE